MEPQTLQATHASEWRPKTEFRTLPSGKVAELKRPRALSMIMRDGNIPDSLAQIILSAIGSGGKAAADWKPDKSDLVHIAELVDNLTRSAFVTPAIVDEPDYDQNQIALDDVEEADKFDILYWALNAGGQATAAARFPGKSAANLSAAQNGGKLSTAPKRRSRH